MAASDRTRRRRDRERFGEHDRARRTSVVALQHLHRAYRATAKTERYDDAVADLDLELGCQAALLLGGGSIVGLAIIRGRREGPCSDTTLRRFRHLSVTAQRAVRMQLAIDNEAAEMMLGNMAAMRSATLLLDRHGNLAALTPKAETLFEDDGPLVLDGLAPPAAMPERRYFPAGGDGAPARP